MKDIERKLLSEITIDMSPDDSFFQRLYDVKMDDNTTPEFKAEVTNKLKKYEFYTEYMEWVNKHNKEEIKTVKEKKRKAEMNGIDLISTDYVDLDSYGPFPFKAISLPDLLDKDIPPLEYLVDGILPKGLGILSAPPKYYKSFLALQACLAICMNAKFLDRDTHKFACIYFDLESGDRRPRDRAKNMLKGKTPPDNMYFVTLETDHIRTIKNGFAESLTETIKQYDNVGLVVVDVFQKIRNGSKRSQNAYEYDYGELTELKQCCEANNVTILLVHHTNKGNDRSDVYNNMSGSTALLAGVDFGWLITKDDRSSKDAVLHITGRDIESVELSVRFDDKGLRWEYVGTQEEVELQKLTEEYEQSNVVQTILKLVKDNNGIWTGSTSEIIQASRYNGFEIYESAQNVGKTINRFSDLLLVVSNIETHFERDSKQRRYTFACHTSH